MARSRSAGSFVRKSRRSVNGGAGTLSGVSGRATGTARRRGRLDERADVMPLERRQMLFSITITQADINPFTGIGSAEATFAYTIPYLATTIEPQDTDPVVRTEEFDDETLQNQLPSGTILEGSFVRVLHNISPGNNISIVQAPGGPDVTDFEMRTRFTSIGQQVRFQVLATEDDTSSTGLAFQSASFDVTADPGSPIGLDTDNVIVELLFDGQVIRSYTGAALRAQSSSGTGIGRFTFDVEEGDSAYDELRIRSTNAPLDAFRIDNMSFTLPAGNFAPIVESRIFGARVAFAGPVGATVTFSDLYGRDIRRTLALGIREGSQITLVDPDDDGVPNFNDGIGAITLSNTDINTSLVIYGGTVSADGGNFTFELVDSVLGLFSEFEQAGFGFGYSLDDTGDVNTVVGLPPGPGSVIIGSPYVRPQNAYNPAGEAPGVTAGQIRNGFNATNQGVFVNGGSSIGTVNIHGAVFGSSNFTGSIDTYAAGYQLGSVTVAGDAGTIYSGTDGGLWYSDPIPNPPDNFVFLNRTDAQIVVGRTLGELAVAGRSLFDVTVVGDLNSQTSRPPRDSSRYSEREVNYAILFDADEIATIFAGLGNLDLYNNSNGFSGTNRGRTAVMFGSTYFRNDNILSAEFVGSASTGVTITGDLGHGDPVNTSVDAVDIFAFAADGSQVVTIEAGSAAAYVRVVDKNGRTLSAVEGAAQAGSANRTTLRFRPEQADVYYLVMANIGQSNDTSPISGFAYEVSITGMAAVTLGAYRSGGASGVIDGTVIFRNTINVLSGSVGSVRVGTGYTTGGGDEVDPSEIYNPRTGISVDDTFAFHAGTFAVAGNLYNISAGGDFGTTDSAPLSFQIGGDLGTMYSGLSGIPGTGPLEGDIKNQVTLEVGGRIATIEISGALGINQDAATFAFANGSLTIRTGTRTGEGSIGMIRFGSHLRGDFLSVTTPSNSTIGGILISQDIPQNPAITEQGVIGGNAGILTNLGSGSDLRFFDVYELDSRTTDSNSFPLLVNTFTEFVDDGGGRVRIRVVGDNLATGTVRGEIIALPVNGSQGVAIARIIVDLTGAALEIESAGNVGAGDVISIGRIVVTASTLASSGITIRGNTEVDVWRIEQTGGDGLLFVTNNTIRGDLVAVDLQALTRIEILTGDLGRTQVPGYGPRLIGPFLGIASGAQNANAAPLGIVTSANAATVSTSWNGAAYRGANNAGTGASGDDIGLPFDPYLNGLVVRNGNLTSVTVGGAVGDVIVQNGEVITVTANADRTTPAGRFDGVVGSIYGTRISLVNVGDGLFNSESNAPLATTGIYATNDILTIEATLPGSFLSGNIVASNQGADPAGDPRSGIDTIRVNSQGGDFLDLFISVGFQDGWWITAVQVVEFDVYLGNVQLIQGRTADFFRSALRAQNLINFDLRDGFFDASDIQIGSDLTTVTATGYRNSTATGGTLEFRTNRIDVGNNLGTLTTTSATGDISDLAVTVVGSVVSEIAGRNFTRTLIDVANTIPLLRATGGLRGVDIRAGQITRLTSAQTIATSSFQVSGPIINFSTADSIINSTIAANGPFGRIDTITAVNFLSGNISSSGPVGTIDVTAGSGFYTLTTTGTNGTVNLVRAAVDLDITTDISATVNTITAGRHIGNRGNPNVILIRGNLQNATAGGQLYSDLRIGQSIVGAVTIGRVSSTPQNNQLGAGSIIAFGAINNIIVSGDFDGDIISYSGGINTITITDGSFLPGNTAAAYDGHFNLFSIVRGSLFGNVHADWILYNVSVVGTADGVFGDIGINPALSSNVQYDAFRGQLPVGVVATSAVNGPRISAGWNLGIVSAPNGMSIEATYIAGRAIGQILIGESITSDGLTGGLTNVVAAGDSIFLVSAGNQINNAFILAGFLDLGSDGVPAGTGLAKDTVQSGIINTVQSGLGGMVNIVFSAGMDPGADGIISTGDDLVTPGVSFINAVITPGPMIGVSATSDSFGTQVLAETRLPKFGTNYALVDPDIDPGFGTPGVAIASGGSLAFTWGADSGTIFFSGPGEAFWDATTGRVVLRNTSLQSNVSIISNTGSLTDFSVVTNDDASVGALFIQSSLYGNSKIVIDAYMFSLVTGFVEGNSSIRLGADTQGITLGSFTGTLLDARYFAGLVIATDVGSKTFDVPGESRIRLLAGGNILVGGAIRGVINIDRDMQNLSAGTIDNARIRAGASIADMSASLIRESRVSIRDFLGSLTVTGNVDQTQITIGGDLGRDAQIGGTGLNADQATSGFAGNVAISGSFTRSDIISGGLRGPDGFFGTSDDIIADGRSTLGTVTIGGTNVGSNRDTESFRILSTGALGNVIIGGLPPPSSTNFRAQVLDTEPATLAVEDLSVTVDSQVYTATITFNQPINFSTFGPALSVSELRGNTQIRLIEGTDYTLSYNSASNAAIITFSTLITRRDLPQTAGVAGPGVYRFELSQAVLRAQLTNQRLDGNNDGFAGLSENYSQDDFVGDAGDKLTPGRVTVIDPNTGQVGTIVDFYSPFNLDTVLDNNQAPDGLPDINREFTLRGATGDHPDNGTNYFSFASDVDSYTITLQAGQILRLGQLQGAAQAVLVSVIGPSGQFGSNQVELASDSSFNAQGTIATAQQNLLALVSGTYTIVIGNVIEEVQDPTSVLNVAPVANGVGGYSLTVEVFDDADTGFGASTNSGDGTNIVNAPAPTSFAGIDGVLGTADDVAQISIGAYTFVYNASTGLVTGTDAGGSLASTRGTDGTQFASINSAIGPTRAAGLPGQVFPDADVFHFNNRQPIAPGTRITVTVRLNQFGTDLGAINQNADFTRGNAQFQDFSGDVQFGIFQTTGATGVADADLLFSPSDFSPNGGPANTLLASSPTATYGYDAQGDFYISFVTPSRQGASDTTAAAYAIYIQGVYNGDYRLEIAQSPVVETITRRTQNVFIETRGGSIDWLEAGGRTTTLDGFNAASLGFTGRLTNGQTVDDYIIQQLIIQLNAAYSNAGLDVRFSTNPIDFEFQDFSTVYLTQTADPTNTAFGTVIASFFGTFITQEFGYSEHSDPLNADTSDEAVIFTQPFSLLGLTPAQADVDRFTSALSTAVERRVGELLGLRLTADDLASQTDFMAANSVNRAAGGIGTSLSNLSRSLSPRLDSASSTNFYLGRQNAGSLLSKYLRSN